MTTKDNTAAPVIVIMIDRDNDVESCSCCSGDFHARWECPSCVTKNAHLAYDWAYSPEGTSDQCPRCGQRVILKEKEDDATE